MYVCFFFFLTFVVWVHEDGSETCSTLLYSTELLFVFQQDEIPIKQHRRTQRRHWLGSGNASFWTISLPSHITLLTKYTPVYWKWLHTQWPPTCFGQPGGRLQEGKIQRLDTLKYKLHKYQKQFKYIYWYILLNKMAAMDVRKVAFGLCLFCINVQSLPAVIIWE